MDFRNSDTITGPRTEDILPTTATAAVKVVIVGGFGVGKTTMVGSVSDIPPLTPQDTITQPRLAVLHNSGVDRQTPTPRA
ncbi:ATP-binding protein, partial [Streptomyces sp. NPDC059744]